MLLLLRGAAAEDMHDRFRATANDMLIGTVQ